MKPFIPFLFVTFLVSPFAADATEVRRAESAARLPASSSRQEQPADMNDAARFIAGLPVGGPGPLAEWTRTPEWISFSNSMNQSWEKFAAGRLGRIRPWANAHLSSLKPATVFYPFSGPDFIYARTFFPHASTYILCGLEPVGNAPSPQNLHPLQSSLGWMEVSMRTLMDAGYFVTKEMKVNLRQSPLQGTVPLFCFMLARNGDHIISVETSASHAEIRFRAPGDSRVRTLHYFSLNLRNEGMRKGSAFAEFLRSARPDVGFIKSDSYLLHEGEFSIIRDILLTQCRAIVQDDSGIPFALFAPDRWRLRHFGAYVAPLDIFGKYYQPGMAAFYAKHPAPPLPFGFGYHWDAKTANLLVFTATGRP